MDKPSVSMTSAGGISGRTLGTDAVPGNEFLEPVPAGQGCVKLGKLALAGENNALGRSLPKARPASDQSRQGPPKILFTRGEDLLAVAAERLRGGKPFASVAVLRPLTGRSGNHGCRRRR